LRPAANGGKLRVIASIEEPAVIERILDHLGHTASYAPDLMAPYTYYPLLPYLLYIVLGAHVLGAL
jgi:hypothetical protein